MITSSQLQKASEIFNSTGCLTRDDIIQQLGVSEQSARIIREIITNRHEIENFLNNQEPGIKTEFESDGNSQKLATVSSDIKTLDQLLEFSNVNLDEWEVTKHTVNSWGSEKNPCYQVKAWLNKKTKDLDLSNILDEFKIEASQYSPEYKEFKHTSHNENMLLISIHDMHIGQLSWNKETGLDYNLKIAIDLYEKAVEYFLSQATIFAPEKIVFMVGSDLLNVDNSKNTTTAGTFQSEDSRFQKSFSECWKMLVRSIDKCSMLAPVDVKVIAGNHSEERTYYLGEVLSCWYSKNENVNIDNSPTSRKYVEYGSNLIGFSHGMEAKINELPLIMATEQSEAWGRTTYKVFNIGHKHHDKKMSYVTAQDIQTVRVEQLPTLAPNCAWSSKKGFNSQKEAVSSIYSKNGGKIAEMYFKPTEKDYD